LTLSTEQQSRAEHWPFAGLTLAVAVAVSKEISSIAAGDLRTTRHVTQGQYTGRVTTSRHKLLHNMYTTQCTGWASTHTGRVTTSGHKLLHNMYTTYNVQGGPVHRPCHDQWTQTIAQHVHHTCNVQGGPANNGVGVHQQVTLRYYMDVW